MIKIILVILYLITMGIPYTFKFLKIVSGGCENEKDN